MTLNTVKPRSAIRRLSPSMVCATDLLLGLVMTPSEDCVLSGIRLPFRSETQWCLAARAGRGLRDQACDQVRIVRQDHRVAVAVGHEYRLVDAAEPLQQGVIRDSPGADRVVLRLAGGPGGRLVSVLGPV